MDLDKLQTGHEFVCWWFDEGDAKCVTCKWDVIGECFVRFISDQSVGGLKVDYAQITNPEKFFSYTSCALSNGDILHFDNLKDK